MAINIPANTFFAVHFKANAGASGKLPNNVTMGGTLGDDYATGVTAQNYDPSIGGLTLAEAIGNTGYSPIVLGYTSSTQQNIVGVGDSIMQGSADQTDMSAGADTSGNTGWFERFVGGIAGDNSLNLGRSGARASRVALAGATDKRIALFAGTAPICINGLGRNDITGSVTTLKSNLQTINARFAAACQKVVGVTLVPYTTSTDNWITTTNQTDASAGNIATHNNNIRTGVITGQTGYLDVSAVAHATGQELIWRADGGVWVYTGDAAGTHPSVYGSTQIAAGLATSSLQ